MRELAKPFYLLFYLVSTRLDVIETDFLSALDGADRRKLVDLLPRATGFSETE